VRSSDLDEFSPTPAPEVVERPVGPRRARSDAPRPEAAPLSWPDRPTPRGPLPLARQRVPGSAPLAGRPAADAVPLWSGGAAVAAVQGWNEPAPRIATPNRQLATTIETPPATRRPRRETARLHVTRTGAWRPVVVAVAAVLILVAFAVHLAVVPLEVLFTWQSPADVFVTSEPEGALVKLDGVALADRAPLRASVRRDRVDHVLEVSYPGYRTSTEIIRYDRSVVLSLLIRLQKEPSPPGPLAPTVAPLPPPPRPLAGRRR